MRLHQLLLFAALVVACGKGTQPTVAKQPKLPTPDRSFWFKTPQYGLALENGAQVYIVPDFSAPMVEVGARYQVGSIHDPPGRSGLAHLAEHLLFQKQPSGPGTPSLGQLLDSIAVHYNAWTTWDYTHYTTLARSEALASVMAIEAQRLSGGCAGIEQSRFEAEREVVRNEIRQRTRDPGARAQQVAIEALFPEAHPYRRPVGGDDGQLAAATYEDLCAFIRTYYTPDRLILSVSGRVERRDVVRALDDTIATVPRGSAPPPLVVAPARATPERVTTPLRIERATLVIAWPVPSRYSEDGMVVDMIFDRVRNEVASALADDAHARGVSLTAFGGSQARAVGLVIGLTDADAAEQVLAAVWKAVPMKGSGVEKPMLYGYRSRAFTRLFASLEPLGARSQLLADYMQFDRTQKMFDGDMWRVNDIELEPFARTYSKLTARARASVLVFTPDESASPALERADLDFEPMEHDASRWQPAVDPAAAHKPLDIAYADSRVAKVTRFTLANGLDVVLYRTYWVPLVRARLVLRAGHAHEPADVAGLAWSAANLLTPPAYDDEQETGYQYVLGGVGDGLRVSVTDDQTVFEARGLSTATDYLVHSLALLLREGTYPPEDVERLKARAAEYAALGGTSRGRRAAQLLYGAVFGEDHPYATNGFPTPASLAKLSTTGLRAFKGAYYRAGGATLILTGRFDPDIAEQHIRQAFGEWSSGTAAVIPTRGAHARSEPKVIADVSDRAMVDMTIAYGTTTSLGDGYAARLVTAEMLALTVAFVREELGASYGVSATYAETAGPGMYRIEGTLDAERAGPVIARVRREIAALPGHEDFDRLFVRARRRVALRLQGSLLRLDAAAQQLTFAARHQLPRTFFPDLLTAVARLTPETAQAAMAIELAPRNEVVLLSAREPILQRVLPAAGISDVDWNR